MISADWVARATAPPAGVHVPDGCGYGYAWWRTAYHVGDVAYEAFYASGNGGQLAIAVPSLDLVVTFMAGNYGNGPTWRRFLEDLVPRYVIPAACARRRPRPVAKAAAKIEQGNAFAQLKELVSGTSATEAATELQGTSNAPSARLLDVLRRPEISATRMLLDADVTELVRLTLEPSL